MGEPPDPPPGIQRLKYKTSANGYIARYAPHGVSFRKLFSDNVYGSPEKALEAAIAWREEAVRLFPHRDRRQWANIRRKNNKSGHVGVTRTKTDTRVDGTHTYAWVAQWCPVPGEPNKRKRRSFSIPKYGEEEAFRLAVEAREKAMAELDAEWPDGFLHRSRDLGPRRAPSVDDGPTAIEGAKRLKLHEARERDPAIRDLKIEAFIEEHGRLFCEICKFSFEDTYGILGDGLIEVHHLTPLSQMSEAHKTTLDDLMCLCSNCHLAIHNGDPTDNLRSLRFIFDARQTQKSDKIE